MMEVFMFYSSTNNEFIKSIKKLNEKKYRDNTNTFLVEGEHLVLEAIKNNLVKYVIVRDNYDFDYDNKIVVTDKVLKYISNLNTPSGIMAVCNKPNSKKLGSRIIVLDNIQDPGNLGTIIRSSVAFNFDTIVISNDSVDVYNSKVIRATQGMLFNVNIIVTDIKEFLNSIKDEYKIIGTDVVNGKSVSDFKNVEKFAIIMGNEGQGISNDTKKLCSDFVYIPMNQDCESLNVGVAASIIMYELGGL